MDVREPSARYLVEQGFKQTELGLLPENWRVGPLHQYWTVTDCKHVTAEFVTVGIPVASIREVQTRFVDLSAANQTTSHFHRLLIEGGREPKAGDLILSRNATVGEMAQVAAWHPPFAMGQDVCLLRRKSSAYSSDFMQSLFASSLIGRQLNDLMVGSTFKRANVEQIRNLLVVMPPELEQTEIGQTLVDAEVLIESLEQLFAKKRQIKQGAMQELLTGQRRLPGFERAWGRVPLGQTLTIRHGKSQRGVEAIGGPFPILASGGVIGAATGYIYDKPSVLIGRKGTINQPQYMDSPFWSVDTLFFSEVMEPNVPKYLYYLFCSINWTQFNEGSGVPSLNASTIEAVEVLMPEHDEQAAIADVLTAMDTELAGLETKLTKARHLKQAMMQALLTGRIRLAPPAAATAGGV